MTQPGQPLYGEEYRDSLRALGGILSQVVVDRIQEIHDRGGEGACPAEREPCCLEYILEGSRIVLGDHPDPIRIQRVQNASMGEIMRFQAQHRREAMRMRQEGGK